MTPGQLLYVLGVITGGAFAGFVWVAAMCIFYIPKGMHHADDLESGHGADRPRAPVPGNSDADKRTRAQRMGNDHAHIRHDQPRPITRAYSGADNIPPVIWPEPGTRIPFRAQPAPAKHGARDTGRLRIAATGDIPAITDDYLEAMRRRCAVDRAMIERGEPLKP
jgi:hypothetical protein